MWQIDHKTITASTQDDVLQAARQGAAAGYVVRADSMQSGRGRLGRVWQAPPGQLYCSVLLRPRLPLHQLPHYAFISALAVADCLASWLPAASILLKWPNDILAQHKKIAGILLETDGSHDCPALVIGCGINIVPVAADLRPSATSLAEQQVQQLPAPSALLDGLLAKLAARSEQYATLGFAQIRADWLARAATGLNYKINGQTGRLAGLADDGSLQLQLPGGALAQLSAGDVELVK